jgi:hypothetical protein
MKKISLLLLMACSSCTIVYHPNTRNLPMFSGKGEFKGTASVTINEEWNVQSAYAVSDHVGIMGNGMIFKNRFQGRHSEGAFGELGAGYYVNTKKYYFDVFGGYGIGNRDVDYCASFFSTLQSRTQGVYHRVFIQPGFGFKTSGFESGLAMRISYLNLYGIMESNEGQPDQWPYTDKFVLEPAGVARYSYKKIFCEFQMGVSLPMANDHRPLSVLPVQVSVGVGVRL